MFNEDEENNNDLLMDSLETREVDGQSNVQEYQERNEFVPRENANVDNFVPQENENAEQFVPPVDSLIHILHWLITTYRGGFRTRPGPFLVIQAVQYSVQQDGIHKHQQTNSERKETVD